MARVDDYAPDLWTPPAGETESSGGAGEAEAPADEEASGEIAPLAHPKIQEVLKELDACFLTPGGSISLFCGKFQDQETIYLHEDLEKWETENPYDTSKQLEIGYHNLYVMQDYPKAVLAYHSALKVFDLDPEMHASLGQAYFGMGEYKKSLDVYEAALELDSRNVDVRRLHMEAGQKYLETLDEKDDAEEITRVKGGLVADKAMLLALNADKEREAFEEIKKQLAAAESPDAQRELLDQAQLLAQSYSALSGAPFADPADMEFVRGELSVLSGEVFDLMAGAAQDSTFVEINRLHPLYHGLSYLARGDNENARDELAKVRSEFPEADEILKAMENDDLRSINIAALDVWESTVEGHEEYQDQKPLIDRVRASIRQGDHSSIKEALAAIADSEEESDSLRAFAKDLLDRTRSGDSGGSEILPHLIEYASTLEPSEDMTEILFTDAQRTEDVVPQGSYGVYCFLEASAPQEKFKVWSKSAREELTREKGFWETFGKTVLSLLPTNPEELALTMVGLGIAQKIGALGRLAALNRLAKAGITGKTALRLALGAEILAEGHVLFGWNTLQGAAYQGAGVFSPENLAMSYGSTLLMLGFLKPSMALGKRLGPRMARALGLVENGGLSKAGERLAWATVHGFGVGGMIASTQANQLLELAVVPEGGFAESLAHDLVSYVKYGFAGKVTEHVLGPKAAAKARKVQEKIALREGQLLAESHLKKLGYAPSSRTEDGIPVYEGEAARELYGQMVYLNVAAPGFSGEKVADLIAKGKSFEAKTYLESFGLKGRYEGGKLVGFEEVSAHEAAGIEPMADAEAPALAREAAARPQRPSPWAAEARNPRPVEESRPPTPESGVPAAKRIRGKVTTEEGSVAVEYHQGSETRRLNLPLVEGTMGRSISTTGDSYVRITLTDGTQALSFAPKTGGNVWDAALLLDHVAANTAGGAMMPRILGVHMHEGRPRLVLESFPTRLDQAGIRKWRDLSPAQQAELGSVLHPDIIKEFRQTGSLNHPLVEADYLFVETDGRIRIGLPRRVDNFADAVYKGRVFKAPDKGHNPPGGAPPGTGGKRFVPRSAPRKAAGKASDAVPTDGSESLGTASIRFLAERSPFMATMVGSPEMVVGYFRSEYGGDRFGRIEFLFSNSEVSRARVQKLRARVAEKAGHRYASLDAVRSTVDSVLKEEGIDLVAWTNERSQNYKEAGDPSKADQMTRMYKDILENILLIQLLPDEAPAYRSTAPSDAGEVRAAASCWGVGEGGKIYATKSAREGDHIIKTTVGALRKAGVVTREEMAGSGGLLELSHWTSVPFEIVQAVHDVSDLPRQVVPNVDALAGNRIGGGLEGTVYELAGDPTRVIKIYKNKNGADVQLSGLREWRSHIEALGLQDQIEVVPTLGWGVDEQGRSFSIHPRIDGEVGLPFKNPKDNARLMDLAAKVRGRELEMVTGTLPSPEAARADGELYSFGNFVLLPNGKFVVIDPS